MLKSHNPIIMNIGEGMGPNRLTPDIYQMRFLCIENIIHLYFLIYLNLLEIILDSKSSLSWDLFHFIFCCSGIIFIKYNHNISLHICTSCIHSSPGVIFGEINILLICNEGT